MDIDNARKNTVIIILFANKSIIVIHNYKTR